MADGFCHPIKKARWGVAADRPQLFDFSFAGLIYALPELICKCPCHPCRHKRRETSPHALSGLGSKEPCPAIAAGSIYDGTLDSRSILEFS